MAKNDNVIDEFDVAAFMGKDWVEEEVSLPPYWRPKFDNSNGKGNGFKATVLAIDERDPEFVRYILEAQSPVVCYRGQADDADQVVVEVGKTFTCSAYAALPLDRFFGLEVGVVVRNHRKLPPSANSSKPRTLYEFRVMVSPETKRILESEKGTVGAEDLAKMRQAARKRALEAMKNPADNAQNPPTLASVQSQL